jgi:two-component system NtrC family sensor kinase
LEAYVLSATGRVVPRVVRERRWWLILLVVWGAVVGVSLQSHNEQTRQQATEVAVEGARNMFWMVLLTRNWNSSHGGIYVPVTPYTQPNPYLVHPRRDVRTTDGVDMTMVNPAYMTRLIGETAEASSGAIFRLSSLRPIRPGNEPDAWERQALLSFEQGIKETTGVERGPQGAMLRYMAPLPVKKSCLDCHAKQGYQVGDVRGGLSVSQRYEPIEEVVAAGEREARITYGIGFVLVVAAGWFLLEVLRRRWFELAHKVDELEASQSQLLQSEKMASIGQLAAGVAHEINNPVGFVNSNLGALKNYSEQMIALLERCRSGQASEADFAAIDFDYLKDDLGDLLTESRDGLERVKKIVVDLKNYSRIDESAWQDADLNSGIESTLNVAWNELKYKADVVRELGDLPPVPCVAAQINQVVMNLLVNAVHAIETHGTITVRSGHDDTWAWIEVADTGKGMTPAVMKRIFEPFYTTKPVGKGTGLGLSLSYDIVRKHDGRIEVSSEVGVGTTFRVVLPLQGKKPDGAASPE